MAYLPGLREFARAAMARVPTTCGLCRDSARGGGLCAYCRHAVLHSMRAHVPRCAVCCLRLSGHGRCPDCAQRPPAFDRIIAAFDYAEPGDLLIHYLKVQRQFTSAGMLAGLLADAVQAGGAGLPPDAVLVPVPSSRGALLRRGFNPAAEVTQGLARRLHRPYRPELLFRVREGRRQASLGRAARWHSAQSLYGCARAIPGAHVAVIDDVLTTGSTLHSAALALKAAGAASVWGLVLARTPYPGLGGPAVPARGGTE